MASLNLQPIIDEIARDATVKDSARDLLNLLTSRILAAPTLAEAQEIARGFAAKTDELAEAVVANTPAADEEIPE